MCTELLLQVCNLLEFKYVFSWIISLPGGKLQTRYEWITDSLSNDLLDDTWCLATNRCLHCILNHESE